MADISYKDDSDFKKLKSWIDQIPIEEIFISNKKHLNIEDMKKEKCPSCNNEKYHIKEILFSMPAETHDFVIRIIKICDGCGYQSNKHMFKAEGSICYVNECIKLNGKCPKCGSNLISLQEHRKSKSTSGSVHTYCEVCNYKGASLFYD